MLFYIYAPGVLLREALAPVSVSKPPALRCWEARYVEMMDVQTLCFHIKSLFLNTSVKTENENEWDRVRDEKQINTKQVLSTWACLSYSSGHFMWKFMSKLEMTQSYIKYHYRTEISKKCWLGYQRGKKKDKCDRFLLDVIDLILIHTILL